MSSSKRTDLILLILAIPVLAFLQYHFNLDFLYGSIIFYGIPALYLSYRAKEHVLRSLVFGIVFGVIAGFIADFIITASGSWVVNSTVLPKIFNILPLDDLVWGFLFVYYIIMFYEYFVDRNRSYVENSLNNFLMYSLVISANVILLLYAFNENLFSLGNPYLILGIPAFVIFPILVIIKNPRYLSRFIGVGVFFFFHSLVFESISTSLGYWSFPASNYIGWVSIFDTGFPLEEFLFFPVLFAFATLCVYEVFYDYRRG